MKGTFLLFVLVSTASQVIAQDHPVQLNWNASTSATGYNVYRSSVSGGSYAKLNPSAISGTTYTDFTAPDSTTQFYVVKAVNAVGESASSNEATAVIPATPVSPPVTLSTLSLPFATVGIPFSANLAAAGGTAPYVFTGTSLAPGLALATNGQITGTPTTAGTYTQAFTVKDSSAPPLSVTVNLSVTVFTQPPPPTSYSFWPSSTVPATPSDQDAGSVELGLKFWSEVDGRVTGIKFYKGNGNNGLHAGTLWTLTGTKLASDTFSSETATGWQTLVLANPVPISAGTQYVVSYHATVGHYSDQTSAFASQFDVGKLHAPAHAGVYAYSSATSFPKQTWADSNYYVDIIFELSPQSPQPISITLAPITASVLANGTQQFIAIVANSADTSVSWSATCGIVDAKGLYTAPNNATGCQVTARSNADQTKSVTATVTVSLPPLGVICDPSAISGLRTGDAYAISVSSLSRTASASCKK